MVRSVFPYQGHTESFQILHKVHLLLLRDGLPVEYERIVDCPHQKLNEKSTWPAIVFPAVYAANGSFDR